MINNKGNRCINSINDINVEIIESFFMFHVLEHLPDPINTLKKINNKLIPNGKIIVYYHTRKTSYIDKVGLIRSVNLHFGHKILSYIQPSSLKSF